MPLCLYAPVDSYTPIHLYASRGVHPPICSPYSCASVYSQRLLHVVGGCKGLPYVLDTSLTPPLYVGAYPSVACPHTQLLASLCISMFWGYPYVMWAFSLLLGVWGCSPISWGFWGHISTLMSICSFLYIFVVHYVSGFYGYDYYSFGYGGIFWPVISLISDSGSFPHRVSTKLGSVWSGSTTTLDAKRLWRCYWLSFCATAVNSMFDASSGLCQLCYGFSTGRFLLQS